MEKVTTNIIVGEKGRCLGFLRYLEFHETGKSFGLVEQ